MQNPSRKFKLFVSLLVLVIGFSLVFDQVVWQTGTKVWLKLESDTSCQIPKIDPFLKSTNLLIELASNLGGKPGCIGKDIKFKTDHSNLFRIDNPVSYWETVNCCYTVFNRLSLSSEIINGEECFPILEDVTHIPETHINLDIKCRDRVSHDVVYRNQLAILKVNSKEDVTIAKEEEDGYVSDKLNVLIIGIDSVSHANFLRFMRKTQEFLVQNLSAIEFHGLNKIGRGTDDNLIALLTGCKLHQPKRVDPACELIWTDFSSRGCTTFHSEDHPHNAKHVYPTVRSGRPGIGTDHDNSVYMAGAHSFNGLNPKNNLLDKYGCFGDQFVYDVLVDGILQTARAIQNKPYFNFVWTTTVAHEVLSNTKYMDEPTFDLLAKLEAENLLNNTIVLLYSDHGLSFGEYSKTEIGTVEGLMPLLYVVFPEWFRNKYSQAVKNVELNSMRLSTPYDIHETLMDLLNLTKLTAEGRKFEERLGQSLFTPLPLTRTCEMAKIPPEYCICWERTVIMNPEQNLELIQAIHFVVKYLNTQIIPFPECEPLEFSNMLMANKLRSRIEGDEWKNYQIVFQTSPNEAEFQALVKLEAGVIELNGEVTRVNAYKNQSSCIAEWENATYVKSICYCKS